ncbi:MAG: VCBS domain-containing protein, partial [Lentilitoribacter sp.]
DNAAVQFLAADETITQVFTITVLDDNTPPLEDTQTVEVTITGTNDGPEVDVLGTDDLLIAEADDASAQEIDVSGIVTFDDVDATDLITITSALNSAPVLSGTSDVLDASIVTALEGGFTAGVVDAAALGSIEWTYSTSALDLDFLAEDQTIELSFVVTATDDAVPPLSASEVVTVRITGTNDAPEIRATSAAAPGEFGNASPLIETDAALSTSGTLNVVDVDVLDTVTITVSETVTFSGGGATPFTGNVPTDVDLASFLTVANATGLTADEDAGSDFVWTFQSGASGNSAFDFLAEDETIVLDYTLIATDGTGATATETVTITITGTNDAPVIPADQPNVGIIAFDSVDVGGSATGAPLFVGGGVAAFSGQFTFTDLDLSDTQTIAVTDLQVTANAGLASVLDPVFDAAFQAARPSNEDLFDLLKVTGSSSLVDTQTGLIEWSFAPSDDPFDFLNIGQSLQLVYEITVSDGDVAIDGDGATDTRTISITINGTNDGPEIDVDASDLTPATIAENSAEEPTSQTDITGSVVFSDVDFGDEPTIELSNSSLAFTDAKGNLATLPIGSGISAGADILDTFIFDDVTGEYTYNASGLVLENLAAGETITLTYTILVTDENDPTLTDNQDVVITITGTNDAPVIASGPQMESVTEDTEVDTDGDLTASGTLDFSDVDLSDAHTVTSAFTSSSSTAPS